MGGLPWAWFVLLVFGALGVLSGCGGGPRRAGGPFFAPPERVLAMGNWNDVDAAVDAGARAAEMAVVTRRLDEGERTRTYELVTVHDEPARLTATVRAGGADVPSARGSPTRHRTGGTPMPQGAGPIELTASVGRFGDTTQERRLLRAVRVRIEMRSGVDSAPLPEDVRELLR